MKISCHFLAGPKHGYEQMADQLVGERAFSSVAKDPSSGEEIAKFNVLYRLVAAVPHGDGILAVYILGGLELHGDKTAPLRIEDDVPRGTGGDDEPER